MTEFKVQPLRALVISSRYVCRLLLSRELRPSCLASLVSRDIVVLDQIEQNNIEAADSQQNLIAADVKWPIVLSVNIRTDNIAGLNKHVI